MAYRSGFSRQRARRRQQLAAKTVMWIGVAGIFLAIGYSSYRTGAALARLEVSSLDNEIIRLNGQVEGLRSENDRLRMDLSQTRGSSDALKRRYDTDVPSGPLASLVALVKDRIAGGVKEDRLAQVIREADAARLCEGRFLRRRFPIQTGAQPEESVSFLDGLIWVSANAPSAAEDPVKAAVVSINRAWASQPLKITGLPVRQSIPINNAELKLTVEPSDIRGYATATLTVCGKG